MRSTSSGNVISEYVLKQLILHEILNIISISHIGDAGFRTDAAPRSSKYN